MTVSELVNENADADRGEHAEWHVYVEYPAPVVIIGQVATERRAEDRAEDHPHAPHRHGLRMPLGRVDLKQHRLGERHQGRAADSLQQAIDHQLGEAGGSAAQGRRRGKADHRDQEHVFDAEAAGEPAGQRRHDRGGDDVRGDDPGDLVLRGRHAALHMRQGDVGDGGVDALHERRQHDRDRDGDAVDRSRGRAAVRRSPHRCRSAAWAVPKRRPAARSSHTSHGRR